MTQLLTDATREGYAVGAFTCWDIQSLQASVETAERLQAPLIVQCARAELDLCGHDMMPRLAIEAIEAASVPAVLNLDHGDCVELCMWAADQAFHCVMLDVAHLPFEDNIAQTRQVVEYAHALGVEVEGELGRIAGIEASQEVQESEATHTDPDEAVEFVERTGVDTLAVAIGNAHGVYKGKPKVNLDRLAQLKEKVPVPLVMHGGSGIPADVLRQAIAGGISKINIYTELWKAFVEGFLAFADTPPKSGHMLDIFGSPKAKAMELVETKMRLFGAAGKAGS